MQLGRLPLCQLSYSRVTCILPEDRPDATGLTINAVIDSYRPSLRAGNK
jgi:hypothetical protein